MAAPTSLTSSVRVPLGSVHSNMSPLANATLISPRLQSDTHAPTVQLRKEASFASPSSFNKNMVSSSPYINRTPGTVRKRLREDNSPNDRDGREYTKTRRIESPARPLYNTYKRGSIGGESEYGREERETIDYWLNLGLGMSMAREMNDPAVNVNAFQHRRSIDGRVSAPVAVTVAAATPRIDRIQMNADKLRTRLRIALFKVQTNQIKRPIPCLKLHPALSYSPLNSLPSPPLRPAALVASLLQAGESLAQEKDIELLEHMRTPLDSQSAVPSPPSSLTKQDSGLSTSSLLSFTIEKTDVDYASASREESRELSQVSTAVMVDKHVTSSTITSLKAG